MQLIGFRVTNFRSISDSTWIDVNRITNIIGVNESGKSNALIALWKLNPVNDGEISLIEDLPRDLYSQMQDKSENMTFIETKWDLTDDNVTLNSLKDHGDFSNDELSELYLSRSYGGEYKFKLPRYEKTYSENYDNILQDLLMWEKTLRVLIEKISQSENGDTDIKELQLFLNLIIEKRSIDYEQIIKFYNLLQKCIEKNIFANEDITFQDKIVAYKHMLEKKRVYDSQPFWETLIGCVPHFVYYSNYGNLDSEIYLPYVLKDWERKDLFGHAAAKVRTLKMLFSFINLKPQEILELGKDTLLNSNGQPLQNATSEQLKTFYEQKRKRTILLDSASAQLTRKFRDWWKQGEYQFDLKADGNFFKIWVSDNKRPAKIELEARSTGLQWFLSFFLTFLVETQGDLQNSILLLDEAGLSLHPMAQKDLIAFFKELSNNNQIIHTTHSPFLVDTNNIDNVKLAYVDNGGHTVLSNDLRANQNPKESKAIYAVHAALGLSVSDILLQGCMPIVVEGVSDQYYLNAIKNCLISLKKISPKHEMIFIPVGGVKGIKPITSIISGISQSLPYVIVDSDKSGQDYKKILLSELYKNNEEKIIEIKDITGIEMSEIEDIIPFACLERGFIRLLRDIEDYDFIPKEDSPIIPQFETYAEQNNISLPKGYKVEIAKVVKSRIIETSKEEEKIKIWDKLFKRLK